MKPYKLLGLLFIWVAFFSGTINPEPKKKIAPPGTIYLRDNLFIDVTPVNNLSYRVYITQMRTMLNFNLDCIQSKTDTIHKYGVNYKEFLNYKDFERHFNCPPNPDSNMFKINEFLVAHWKSKDNYRTYLNAPNYNYYPVVNISYETAKKFCEWRTWAVMFMRSMDKTAKERNKYYSTVQYRLPTKEEWEYALDKFKSTIKYPPATLDSTNIIYSLNERGGKDVTAYQFSNLSEMLFEKNIAKGRNWADSASFNNINYTTNYNHPEDWLTFRCVCEVKE